MDWLKKCLFITMQIFDLTLRFIVSWRYETAWMQTWMKTFAYDDAYLESICLLFLPCKKARKENNRQDMSSKLLFFISANWMASQSNWFRALYDERKIQGKFICRVFWSIRSLYAKYNPELYILNYRILHSKDSTFW